ncbi:DNA translocase FtsK [Bacteroidota bacterium]
MPRKTNKYKKNILKDTGGGKSRKKKTSLKKSGKFIGFFTSEKTHWIFGLFLSLFSIYLLIVFVSYFFTWWKDYDIIHNSSFWQIIFSKDISISNVGGRFGVAISNLFITKMFGISSFLFVFLFFNSGIKLFLKIRLVPIGKAFRYSIFIILWLSVAFGYFFKSDEMLILGGIFGYESNLWLKGITGNIGIGIILFFTLLSFLILGYNVRMIWFKPKQNKEESVNDELLSMDNIEKEEIENDQSDIISVEEDISGADTKQEEDRNNILVDEATKDETDKAPDVEFTYEKAEGNNGADVSDDGAGKGIGHQGIETQYDPTLDLPGYKNPGIDLLDDYSSKDAGVKKDELEANKNRIVETLNNYAISIDKIKATIGPTVTLYEIVPSAGVRISKIKNLEDDIALSLSAMGIRIVAPIPGKGTIGIEVPNQNPEIVSIKSILGSEKFRNSNFELPFGIGKTISNESFIVDLTRLPHILMAGATGQGKSVGLNAIITSLLYKKHPAQLKFVLIDPKKVELSLFSKIERHFLAKLPDSEEAIITDTRKVVRTLNSLNIEMDKRYDLLKAAQVRNIKEYNTKFIARKLNPNEGHRFLPYFVLVIDEFADLIMTAGKEIETPLTRLAQLARAIGIHLIIATQRPSVNIITGTIKANFPARIAFRVISKIDSRTILDTSGADQLIGRGDMLLATGSDVTRLQCAFVDTHEVDKVTEYIGSQKAYSDAFHLPEYFDEDHGGGKDFNPDDRDELFEEAARIIVQHQHGSTSLLQRKLKLGYNRAGRIIDQLEAAGIVGPFEGSKARDVKITDEIALEQFLRDNLKDQ